MQNLGPLPNDVILTMKLHYYNSVTPYDYQPPGFKEGVNSHFLLFEGEPVTLRMGSVSSGFHSMKVKVTTEATRMLDGENGPVEESSTTEIAHQGLDCDEEEEDSSSPVALCSLANSSADLVSPDCRSEISPKWISADQIDRQLDSGCSLRHNARVQSGRVSRRRLLRVCVRRGSIAEHRFAHSIATSEQGADFTKESFQTLWKIILPEHGFGKSLNVGKFL
ncbi:hypothetical protein A6R68_21092, partial [Neotoma lepida]